jgi:hyperosmotically inducible periplasmic protein
MKSVLKCVRFAVLLAAVASLPALAAEAGETGSDGALHHALTHVKIRAALVDKLGGDGLHIDIDLAGSKATLRGEVEKQSSRDLAKEVALSVSGVREVDNELRVVPEHRRSAGKAVEAEIKDTALEIKVKHQLLTEIGANALKIEVEVSDGVVSLRGTVPTAEVEKLAVRKAEHAGGVRKVINLLRESAG